MTTARIKIEAVKHCANCGEMPEPQKSKAGRQWLQCTGCGARTRAYRDLVQDNVTIPAQYLAQADWGRGIVLVPRIRRESISARSIRRSRTPQSSHRILELLARMLVSTSYRTPVEGKGTSPGLLVSDIAAALGFVQSRLNKAVAVAVVTRAGPLELAKVTTLALPSVARQLRALQPRPLDMKKPADRWRLRMVVFAAAEELVWPERRRPYSTLAREAKTRKQSYMATHRAATAVLQEAMSKAESELKVRMRGR